MNFKIKYSVSACTTGQALLQSYQLKISQHEIKEKNYFQWSNGHLSWFMRLFMSRQSMWTLVKDYLLKVLFREYHNSFNFGRVDHHIQSLALFRLPSKENPALCSFSESQLVGQGSAFLSCCPWHLQIQYMSPSVVYPWKKRTYLQYAFSIL